MGEEKRKIRRGDEGGEEVASPDARSTHVCHIKETNYKYIS
jgi:hypothetical protein